jgi:5-methylthioribose kinase
MVDFTKVDAAERRMQIQQELLEMAQHFITIRHEIEIVHEDKEKDFYVR